MKAPVAIYLIIVSVLVWGLYGSANVEIASLIAGRGKFDVAMAGQWGDTFGAFTAFFSTIGTFGVIWTLILQQRGLAAQARDIHKQRFDATFFELLRLMKDAKRELKFAHSIEFIKAKYPAAADLALAKLREPETDFAAVVAAKDELRHWVRALSKVDRGDQKKVADVFIERIFKRYPGRFGAYYRLIYSLMNRIDKDKYLSDQEKVDYARLLRAQFTADEIVLMAFNGLSDISGDSAALIVRLRMLKYIHGPGMKDFFSRFYGEGAFAPRD